MIRESAWIVLSTSSKVGRNYWKVTAKAITSDRTNLYERTAERFGIGTKSGGIDAACEFSTQMLRNLERAAEHDDMTEDLAELLSTANVTVEYRLETGLEID